METGIEITLEDMIAQLGGPVEQETPPEEPNPETPPVDETPPTEETPPSEGDNKPPAEQQNPMDTVNADKAGQAFAHMRQQNKKYADVFKGIAKVLNVQGTDEEAILSALQAKITEAEAKQSNVPVELYEKLQRLEQRDQEFAAMQTQQRVAVGFENVRAQYNLSPDEVNQFATDLIQSGRNPLETNMDLVNEYKVLYFDKIIQKQVDSALATERERASKATNQSTTPSEKAGGTIETGDGKVSSVQDLEAWFKAQMS